MEKIQELLGQGFLFDVLLALGQFLAAVAGGWIIRFLLNTVGRRLIAKTKSTIDDKILEIIVDRIVWLSAVFGAYLASQAISRSIDPDNRTAIQFLQYAEGIIFVSFVAVLTLIIIRIIDSSIKTAIETHALKTSSRFNEALLPLINRIVNLLVALIALIIVLDHFGQDVSSLVVSLGVGSLAIALAAQDTLANMIGGFAIMLDRPFRVGDRIKLPSGEIGDVYEIGIRSTKILDFDNNLIITPNADLIKSKIINYSYPVEIIRVIVEVGVAYGTNIDRARSIMLTIAGQHPEILKDPEPLVLVTDLADSSVNLRLMARTTDFRNKFFTEALLRERIYNAFNEQGIQIPFPQRVVHMRNLPHDTSQNPKE